MSSSIPSIIADRYERRDQIGAGGMGTVYLGVDRQTGAAVAIKSLRADAILHDPGIIERFNREAEALRQLNHPNIVKVLDSIESDDQHYIIMPYVSGGSLSDVLRRQPQLPVERILTLSLELADALTRAHYLRIVHRDLKPANVLVDADGTALLTDFGIAQMETRERVTETGVAVGTPDYMSPEALDGADSTTRTDIWSFGVMLFEMLAGRRPFEGETVTQVMIGILTKNVPDLEALRPGAPVALVDLVYRMLEKDPEARIPSVRLVGAELEAILHGIDLNTSSLHAAHRPLQTNRFEESGFVTPTPQTAAAPRHNLPAEPTPFIGRERELDELARLLNDPAVRLVTVLGPGGMGKTRLTLEAARARLDDYPDGVYFVSLAPLMSADGIVPAVADAVKFDFAGGDQRQQLLDYFREKRMLLVMDNFEHVIDGADLVADMLRASPDIKVLASSREKLRLSGENALDLAGLDVPASDSRIETAAEDYSAVRLFLQGARRAQPGFELSEGDLLHIVHIARMVQGMPLGILLAAAWVEALSLGEIEDEINRSLDFLETEMRDVPERHRSVRAVFEYSWNLLNDDERDTFMKLSVFRGGFDREAAQHVSGASLRTLTTLVNKSLLRREASGRYLMHLLLRQYAEEHLAAQPDLLDTVNRAHTDYYAELLERLMVGFNTAREQSVVDAIDIEIDNLRIAWHRALEAGRWDIFARIIQPMLLFYLARSMLQEGVQALETLCAALTAAGMGDTDLYWRARIRQVWMAGRLGQFEQSLKLARQALEHFRPQDNQLEMSLALNGISYAHMMQGRYDESVRAAREAADLALAVGAKDTWILSLGNLGYVEFLRGNYEEALAIYRRIESDVPYADNSPISWAYNTNNQGEILSEMGRFDEARALFEKALATFRAFKLKRGIAFTVNNIAGIAFRQGDLDGARAMYHEAHALYKEVGDVHGLGHALSALGNLEFFVGRYAEATPYFRESLKVRESIGDQRGIADSHGDLGLMALMQLQFDDVLRYTGRSLEIRREIGDQRGICESLSILATATLMGKRDEAATLRYANEVLQLGTEINYTPAIVYGSALLGEVDMEHGRYDAAVGRYRLVLNAEWEVQQEPMMFLGMAAMAQIMAETQGRREDALALAAFVTGHPRAIPGLTDRRAHEMQERLTAELPHDVAAAAKVRGESLSFEEAVALALS